MTTKQQRYRLNKALKGTTLKALIAHLEQTTWPRTGQPRSPVLLALAKRRVKALEKRYRALQRVKRPVAFVRESPSYGDEWVGQAFATDLWLFIDAPREMASIEGQLGYKPQGTHPPTLMGLLEHKGMEPITVEAFMARKRGK